MRLVSHRQCQYPILPKARSTICVRQTTNSQLRHLLLAFHTHVMPKKSAESGYLHSFGTRARSIQYRSGLAAHASKHTSPPVKLRMHHGTVRDIQGTWHLHLCMLLPSDLEEWNANREVNHQPVVGGGSWLFMNDASERSLLPTAFRDCINNKVTQNVVRWKKIVQCKR